ncbi:helicase [Micrococcales bacterium 31B]|nr:helicase [Micrococcales bacterium 31B]
MKRHVGQAAYTRARQYFTDNLVRALDYDAETNVVISTVSNPQGRMYRSRVRLANFGPEFGVVDSRCSCPVGRACKHVAATLMTFRASGLDARVSAAGSAARAASSPIPSRFRASEDRGVLDAADASLPQLGLLFQPFVSSALSLDQWHKRASDAPVSLRLRPTAQTVSGSWPRNGINWSDLDAGLLRRTWPEAQILALTWFAKQYRDTQYGVLDWVDVTAKHTQDLWEQLCELRDLGVTLWAYPDVRKPVTMHDAPARLAMHLSKDERHITLRPRVSMGDSVFDGHNTVLIGAPAHAMLAWEHSAKEGFTYHLARVVPPADPSLRKMVHRRKAVTMPARQIEEFQSLFLPALREKIDVVSTDLDFAVEDPRDPMLQLDLWHNGPADLRVTGQWIYFYDVSKGVREEVRVPFAHDAPTWFARDSAREREIAERVDARLLARSDLSPRDLSPRGLYDLMLASDARLRGREALDFAATHGPALAEGGDVRIVEHNGDRVYRAATSTPQVSLTTSELGQRDWFDLHVTVSIDGEEVPLAELITAMAQQDGVMVLASGTYFDTNVPELQKLRDLIHEARELNDSKADELRVSRYQVSLLEDIAALNLVQEQSEAWQQLVQGLTGGEVDATLEVPGEVRATLRPYQVDGYRWLAYLQSQGLGGVLADDMGLGKTLQIISMVSQARSDDPYLVVCPTSVIGNWVHEVRKFAPHLRVASVDETSRRRAGSLARDHDENDIIVTSYTIFRLDFDEFGDLPWAGAIFDEAQFLKNSRTKVYECAKLLRAGFKVAATGTPMENRLAELWSIFSIVAPGLYPAKRRFDELVARPIERDGDQEVLDTLRRRIRPFMLRRTKEEVVRDLPPKVEQVLDLDLAPEHRHVYDMLLNRERQKVLGLLDDLPRNQIQVFRSLTTLRQAALDVALVDPSHEGVPSTKLDFLVETLQEIIAEEHRVIVFSQFTGFLGRVREVLTAAGIDFAYLDGSTRKRADVIDAFKQGEAPVFLISLKAGGFGLNLTEADYCIVLDPWWNPAAEEQAVDRVHRIGQTKSVMVYRLVATNTIEEKVMALKAQKAALFDAVLEGGFAQAASLTADEIRGLLA